MGAMGESADGIRADTALIDDPANGGSEPGAYADALHHSKHITVSEHEPLGSPAGSVKRRAGHTVPHNPSLSGGDVNLAGAVLPPDAPAISSDHFHTFEVRHV